MEVLGSILVLLSFGVFLWAVVWLINPSWARLPHRKMSVAVWVLSVVPVVAGSSLLPSGDSTKGSTDSSVGGTPARIQTTIDGVRPEHPVTSPTGTQGALASQQQPVTAYPCPLAKSTGEQCFPNQTCPTPWTEYRSSAGETAWGCDARNRPGLVFLCNVEGPGGYGGCTCSSREPDPRWRRVDVPN